MLLSSEGVDGVEDCQRVRKILETANNDLK